MGYFPPRELQSSERVATKKHEKAQNRPSFFAPFALFAAKLPWESPRGARGFYPIAVRPFSEIALGKRGCAAINPHPYENAELAESAE
jgi:hypothetical protein